jgi:hypothetical protein
VVGATVNQTHEQDLAVLSESQARANGHNISLVNKVASLTSPRRPKLESSNGQLTHGLCMLQLVQRILVSPVQKAFLFLDLFLVR